MSKRTRKVKIPIIQGDRNGVPSSFPRVELVEGLRNIMNQGGGRDHMEQYVDLWEAKHGPLGTERSAFIVKTIKK